MQNGRVAEMKSAARPFMRRPKEYVADRLWKNKRLGKEDVYKRQLKACDHAQGGGFSAT